MCVCVCVHTGAVESRRVESVSASALSRMHSEDTHAETVDEDEHTKTHIQTHHSDTPKTKARLAAPNDDDDEYGDDFDVRMCVCGERLIHVHEYANICAYVCVCRTTAMTVSKRTIQTHKCTQTHRRSGVT